MYIKILAALFAAYECYKMLNPSAYIKLIKQAKAAYQIEETAQFMADPFFRKVLLIELAYILFALFLLFTPYWYFTAILFLLSIVIFTLDTAGRRIRLLLTGGSALCAIILMIIVLA